MIRPATTHDAQAFCDIYNFYVENSHATFAEAPEAVEEFQQRIETQKLPWLAYEIENQVLGYCYAAPLKARSAYRFAVEISVYVDCQAVGQGIGKKLYIRLLNRLKELGMHTAIGGVALPNPASIALHEGLGFTKVAHFQQVGRKFDQWIDVGYWQIFLSQWDVQE